MIHNVSNFGLNRRTEVDKTLTIITYLLLAIFNKNRNSVMYYSKNSPANADNIGKMKRVGDGGVSLGFIYSVCFEALGGPEFDI